MKSILNKSLGIGWLGLEGGFEVGFVVDVLEKVDSFLPFLLLLGGTMGGAIS